MGLKFPDHISISFATPDRTAPSKANEIQPEEQTRV